MIEVSHLTKKYGDHVAVNDLSFSIENGHIYGFLGPNGAGKSTTMNMMTGYLAPSDGQIVINGIDMKEDPEAAKKCIGYLPELPPVYMDMTVGEYLKFVAELKKVPKAERKAQIEEVEELTKVADVDGRLIRNLSKGYRQRVGLAQAIIGNPEVLILDEPMVGLDPKQIIEIRDLIKQLGTTHTVILSSHILSEISQICDHILIINKGQLVAEDSPENLMAGSNSHAELILTARGTVEACEEIVNRLPGVSVTSTYTEETNETRMTIECEGGRDLREDLFFAFADARIALVEMAKPMNHSLEDVFLALTEKAPEQHTILKRKKKKAEITETAVTENTEEGGNNDEGNI